MRQACHESTHVVEKRQVSKESCTHFFQEDQPGYGGKGKEQSKSDNPKEEQSQGSLFPTDLKDLQQGPQYNSKKAQKAADAVADGQDEQKENQEPRAQLDAPDSLQRGPNYESKKAQKGSDKAADAHKKAGPREGGVGEEFNKALRPFGKLFKEAQKGPNYHKNLPDDKEEPEEKEVPSVPGCRNSPKGWADTKDRDCEDYAEGEWCTRHGGYGDAWLDEWGTFEEVANKGKSAKEACCVCGGGQRKGEEPSEKPSTSSGSDAPAPPAAPAPAIKGPILGTKSGRALQEQGYSGELVAHEDQVTMTSDWGREFGPHAGHRDIKTICLETPGNEWCELHGYYDKPRSAASMKSVAAVLVTLLFACLH